MNLKDIILEKYKTIQEKDVGVYVGITWDDESTKEIYEYFKDKIPQPLVHDKYHTTLVYSKTNFDYEDVDAIHEASMDKLHIFKNEKLGHTALVIKLKSPSLVQRHKSIHEDEKASYDYDEYIPHVTLSYDVSSMSDDDLDTLMKDESFKNLKLTNGKEYSEPIDENF